MTILSRIRSRVGLLIGIIFLALLAFILTDLFSSQRGIFGGGPGAGDVGEINGNTISYGDFRKEVDRIEAQQQRNLSEQELTQVYDGIWQQMIDKHVFEPEWSKLGITVTEDELVEQMYGDRPSQFMTQFFQDRQTGMIMQEFSAPDGSLSGKAIRDFVKKMPAETEQQWAQIEIDLRKFLMREKYNNLLRKGFYVTTAQAKREYADENTKYNFKYIVKRFSDVPDSTVKVTDAEMRDYYQSHQFKFKQRENSRNAEYVAFTLSASAQDIADQRTAMTNIVNDFKTKKASEDSLYVVAQSSTGAYTKAYLRPGTFPVGTDSAFMKAAPGEVLGPFNQNNNLIIYKVLGQKTSADSAKVRHILIAHKGGERADPTVTRTKEQAKVKADSILRVVKSGKAKMEDIVEKLTDDPGSKSGNKGDYGWFTEESGFVQEFKDAGFKNPVGATVVVETAFGYHVIQVLDRTKETPKVQVVAIEKQVEPSETTIREIYNKASEFAGRNNTGELFTSATQKEHLNVVKADNITEGSRYISGIENPRDIIRWVYDEKTEEGSVSSPFQSGDRYLVVRVTKIINKGTKDFEDVREICELEARKIKKAQMFTEQLNAKKGSSLDQWAAATALTVQPGVNVTLAQPYIQGAGYEGVVVGSVSSMKPGQLSAPIAGTMGVYVVMLENVAKPEPIKDIKGQQTRLMTGLASRADATANEVLKEEADITDNRAKHF
jgi:peptidyl-prolyl cis-trans isomerase D